MTPEALRCEDDLHRLLTDVHWVAALDAPWPCAYLAATQSGGVEVWAAFSTDDRVRFVGLLDVGMSAFEDAMFSAMDMQWVDSLAPGERPRVLEHGDAAVDPTQNGVLLSADTDDEGVLRKTLVLFA